MDWSHLDEVALEVCKEGDLGKFKEILCLFPQKPNQKEWTMTFSYGAGFGGSMDFIKFLEENGLINYDYLLSGAAKGRNHKIARLALEHPLRYFVTPFHDAQGNDDVEMVRLLLPHIDSSYNAYSTRSTRMHLICRDHLSTTRRKRLSRGVWGDLREIFTNILPGDITEHLLPFIFS